jgi:hypothetical protein
MLGWLTFPILKYIAAGLFAVAVGLSIALWAKGVQLGHMENARDKAQNDLKQAKVTIAGYESAVKQCNDATAKLKAESAQKQATADENLARARADAKKHQPANQKRAAILVAPTPSGADCRHAVAEDLKP